MGISENLKSEISKHFSLVGERKVFLQEVEQLTKSLYDTRFSVQYKLDAYLSLKVNQIIVYYLHRSNIELEDTLKVQALLNEIVEFVQGFDTVAITLGFDPSMRFLREVAQWFSVLLGRKVLLDVNIENSVVGGCIVNYNGKYIDYTLKKTLEELFVGADVIL